MRGPSLTRGFESEVNNVFSRNTSKSYSPRMMRILSRVSNLLSPVFSPYYLYLKRDPIHDGDRIMDLGLQTNARSLIGRQDPA